MIRIAICDDNCGELEQTYSYVENYQKQRTGTGFSVEKFQNEYTFAKLFEIKNYAKKC